MGRSQKMAFEQRRAAFERSIQRSMEPSGAERGAVMGAPEAGTMPPPSGGRMALGTARDCRGTAEPAPYRAPTPTPAVLYSRPHMSPMERREMRHGAEALAEEVSARAAQLLQLRPATLDELPEPRVPAPLKVYSRSMHAMREAIRGHQRQSEPAPLKVYSRSMHGAMHARARPPAVARLPSAPVAAVTSTAAVTLTAGTPSLVAAVTSTAAVTLTAGTPSLAAPPPRARVNVTPFSTSAQVAATAAPTAPAAAILSPEVV